MSNEVTIRGLDDVMRRINDLDVKMKSRIVRKAARAGINHIRTIARQEAPKDTGLLRRSIKVKVDRIRGGGGFVAKIYVSKEAWYARLIEFGVQPHKIDPLTKKALKFGGRYYKSVEHPGIPANPFMSRSYSRAKASILPVVSRELIMGLELNR